jgi:hypothetical protein
MDATLISDLKQIITVINDFSKNLQRFHQLNDNALDHAKTIKKGSKLNIYFDAYRTTQKLNLYYLNYIDKLRIHIRELLNYAKCSNIASYNRDQKLEKILNYVELVIDTHDCIAFNENNPGKTNAKKMGLNKDLITFLETFNFRVLFDCKIKLNKLLKYL